MGAQPAASWRNNNNFLKFPTKKTKRRKLPGFKRLAIATNNTAALPSCEFSQTVSVFCVGMGSPAKDATPHRTNIHTPGCEPDSPLPPIHERLAYLRPSRELLEFYRQKIAQFDGEHEELLQMLEKYKAITEDQHKLQWEVRQREGEIAELQNALSDMQVYLFQEREQSLRLYAENDRLKIRELGDRKKIQHLLALVGPDTGEITYFHREPPHKVTITQRNAESRLEENLNLRPTKLRPAVTRKESSRRTKSADGVNGESLEQYRNDNQTLLLQVEALQAQMEEQTRLAKEQVESLLEDRRIKTEEAEAQLQRDQERITALTDKLLRTQNLLYESTKDFLQLKFDTRAHEKSWMVEKDRLLRELDSCHNRLRKAGSGGAELGRTWQPSSSTALLLPRPQPESQQTHKEELKAMQEDLKQAHRLAEMYREQCITLETELAQIREEGDVGREIFKERSDKMAKRLQLMTQRYEALEKRRAMEVEGFKTDLKHLRQKFKDVEKQLLKATLNIGPNQDLAILHEVRQTNTRTKKVQGELMALKAKIYGLENELRFS
ncbi:coiled-coil domain-containing protein 77 [Siniperca chuatsi]|uniref:coiled-coil domain-containing protein 77 n=1 Tax=Siniperca chuatsi TaxID=119488 RepID=UPI001CE148F2|nr:coiled-coil domain-containing protein 77 [Siniperca chuatsi]